jgi:hypothetical protein
MVCGGKVKAFMVRLIDLQIRAFSQDVIHRLMLKSPKNCVNNFLPRNYRWEFGMRAKEFPLSGLKKGQIVFC